VLLAALSTSASAAPGVLVLYSDERVIPANVELEAALRLELGLPAADIEYSAEFLDSTRFSGSGVEAAYRDFLKGKYAGRDIRVLVAASTQALEFLVKYQPELFPGLPVIVAAVPADRLADLRLPANFKVLTFLYQFGRTVELARKLQPDAKEIVVATGVSEADLRYEAAVRKELAALPGALPVRYLRGLPLEAILAEVSTLTPASIGLSIPILTDGAGRSRIPLALHIQIVAASGAPYYSVFSTYLGSGIVGGEMTTFAQMGTWTGQVVKELLSGASLVNLSTPMTVPSEVAVDWRALQRWGLDEARLPPGTEVRFKSLSVWRQYRWLIVTVSALVALQAVSLAALLIQRRRRDAAEAEVHTVRNEIAHLSRVSLVGELSTSLAHELRQPLTAILSNAQAVRRYLASPSPDMTSVTEIVNDIITEDRRAGEVINRLRSLMKKGEPRVQTLRCEDLLREVTALLKNELVERNVTVSLAFAPALPSLRGDRIQLEQVLINLIINAADSMRGLDRAEREIEVSAARGDGGTVEVRVSDRGHGIAPDQEGAIFEPFFTTKAEGLGMGLAISRTIVEEHAGRLWATNNPERGATLHLVLPGAQSGPDY